MYEGGYGDSDIGGLDGDFIDWICQDMHES
jgi:hypothetical protein